MTKSEFSAQSIYKKRAYHCAVRRSRLGALSARRTVQLKILQGRHQLPLFSALKTLVMCVVTESTNKDHDIACREYLPSYKSRK